MARDRSSRSHRRVYSGRVDRRGSSNNQRDTDRYNRIRCNSTSLGYVAPPSSRQHGYAVDNESHAAHRTLPSLSSQNAAISNDTGYVEGPIRSYTSMPSIGRDVTEGDGALRNSYMNVPANVDIHSADTARSNLGAATPILRGIPHLSGPVDAHNSDVIHNRDVTQRRAEVTAAPHQSLTQANLRVSDQAMDFYNTQVTGRQEELSYRNSHDEIDLALQNYDSAPPPPIPDVVSGYTITELPRPVDRSAHHQQILMMDGTDVSAGFSNSGADFCAGSRSQCFADIIDSLPPPYGVRTNASRRTRRHRRRRRRHRSSHHRRRHSGATGRHQDERNGYVKPDCCSMLSCKIGLAGCLQFRRVLISFASFGLACILIGIVLGVLRAPGNSFLTLSLLFVGLGLILLTMVLVGWKCTPLDHEPCHMLFGLGSYCALTRRDRRRRERLFWFGNRAPPPSYAAAMQDYRSETRQRELMPYMPGSPPPSYKSHTTIERPGVHIIFPRNDGFPNSNPPTYRLRTQTTRPSIAILNDANLNSGMELPPPNRFSVSSTAELVGSEESVEPETPGGIVNLSFNDSGPDLELSHSGVQLNSQNAGNNTADGAVQTDETVRRLNDGSFVITLDAEESDGALYL